MAVYVKRWATYLVVVCSLIFSSPASMVLATSSDEAPSPPLDISIDQINTNPDPGGAAIIKSDDTESAVDDVNQDSGYIPPADDITNDDVNSDEDVDDIPPVNVSSPGLVVTKLQTRSGLSASSELIELRNNGPQPMDITGWRLYYTSASPDWKTAIVIAEFTPSESAAGWRVTLGAGQYMLFVTDQYLLENPALESSGIFRSTLANAGRIVIEDNIGQIHGGLAWGGINTLAVEGTPAETHLPGEIISRKFHDDSWHQHTRDNVQDFEIILSSGLAFTPSSVTEIFDACLNIAGISELVPDGWYRDDSTGYCSETPPVPVNLCIGLVISEIGANLTDQFIELHNTSDESLVVDGCIVTTDHTASIPYVIADLTMKPKSYHSLMLEETELRLYKTTSSKVYVLDQSGEVEIDTVVYSSLKPDTSWALIDGDWVQTYKITPGEPNQSLLYPPCEAGYIRNTETSRCNKLTIASGPVACELNQFRNPETGRCKLIASATSELVPCQPGQFRNPETNRCKSLTTSSSTLQPCAEGQFRNPETNRCKKIEESGSTLKPCQSGYERNPETNRCRKSTSTAAVASADFPVEPIKDTGKAFMGWWALGGVLCFGLAYAGWEWRHEVIKLISRAKT